MSIRPIDYNVMLPKTQDVSSAKHIEGIKNRNIVESGFIQQEKIIIKNKKKVMDTEKGTRSKNIGENKSKKEGSTQNKKRKGSKQSLNKEEHKNIGANIDIRI